jgi:hypothetical protein
MHALGDDVFVWSNMAAIGGVETGLYIRRVPKKEGFQDSTLSASNQTKDEVRSREERTTC